MYQGDSDNIENIKRKIAALKKLHDGAFQIHSYHEAETAAFMMQKLLTQYNLTLDAINVDGRGCTDNYVHEVHSMNRNKVYVGRWLCALRGTICRYTFCLSFSTESNPCAYELAGTPDNVATALWMIEYLATAFSRNSLRRYVKYRYECIVNMRKPIGRTAFRQDYLIGCVEGLKENFERNFNEYSTCDSAGGMTSGGRDEGSKPEQKESSEPAPSKCSALSLRTRESLRDYVAHVKGKQVPKGTVDMNTTCDEAVSYGRIDGREISLNKQLPN